MLIRRHPIDHLCAMIRKRRYLSVAGFSDAEWFCILGGREGEKTALGQTLTAAHGDSAQSPLRK